MEKGNPDLKKNFNRLQNISENIVFQGRKAKKAL